MINSTRLCGGGHQMEPTQRDQHTGCCTQPASLSLVIRLSRKLGHLYGSKYFSGWHSGEDIGQVTVEPDTVWRQGKNATFVTKRLRQLTTSCAAACMLERYGFMSVGPWGASYHHSTLSAHLVEMPVAPMAGPAEKRLRFTLRSYVMAAMERAQCSLL